MKQHIPRFLNVLIRLMPLLIICMVVSGCASSKAKDEEAAAEESEPIEDTTDEKAQDKPNSKTNKEEDWVQIGSPEDAGIDYEKAYDPVMQDVINLIVNGPEYEPDNPDYDFTGIWERVAYAGDENLLESIGYVITDINGDSVPELLIGENDEYGYDNPTRVAYIYNGFTYENGNPVPFLTGWGRNRQHYLGNGHFLNSGSGGASNSIFAEWHLDPGNQIVWDDCYFTEFDETTGGIAFYHNTNGFIESDRSDRLDISDAEFDDIVDSYKCESINWTNVGEWNDGAAQATYIPKTAYGTIRPFLPGSITDDVFGVVLGAFRNSDNCIGLQTQLEDAGFMDTPIVYTPDFSDLNPEPYYIVTAGLYSTRQEAQSVLEDVKSAGFSDAYIKYAGTYTGKKYLYTMYSAEDIEIHNDKIILHDVEVSLPYDIGTRCETDLVVDKNTIFDETANMQFFGNYEDGMSPYRWVSINYDLMNTDPDKYMAQDLPALVGIFEVCLDGNLIKSYNGCYWWD